MLFIDTELIFFNADLLLVTAGIKKIPTLGLKRSQGGNFYLGQGPVFDSL